MRSLLTTFILLSTLTFSACQSSLPDKENAKDSNNTSNIQSNTTPVDASKPTFLTSNTNIKINEGKKFIGIFKASDNSDITYSTDNTNFEIDSNAQLSFNVAPSFNQSKSNNYIVTIEAKDTSSNISTLKLNIEVLDVSVKDESVPVFAKSSDTINIDQGNISIDNFTATDNSDVTYTIEGSDKFKIDNEALLSFKALHFYDDNTPSNNTFTLQIIASDTSNNISKMDLTIIINKPKDIHLTKNRSSHNQGRACLDCHGTTLGVAGTIYSVSGSSSAAKFFYIRVVKSNGDKTLVKAVQGYGNFANKESLPSGNFKIEVLNANDQVVNSTSGFTHNSSRKNCNSCHTKNGSGGAPGRILSSQI